MLVKYNECIFIFTSWPNFELTPGFTTLMFLVLEFDMFRIKGILLRRIEFDSLDFGECHTILAPTDVPNFFSFEWRQKQ